MALNKRDRAQLGEQSPNDDSLRATDRSRDVSTEHRGQPVERETIGERGKQERIDTTAGDEGVDDGSISSSPRRTDRSSSGESSSERSGTSGRERDSQERSSSDKKAHRMAGNEPGTIEQSGANREAGRGNVSQNDQPDKDAFSGQGGQKGGKFEKDQEGTGYTSDRSGQLQEDDSLSGSQGRHGKSGSRQGASGNPKTGTSEQERTGGQTAQNPREGKKDRQ